VAQTRHSTADPDAVPGAHPDTPDPRFWGSEPRTLRRPRRRAARVDRNQSLVERCGAFADRLRDTRLELGVGVLLVALVAVAAGVVWYRMGAAGGDTGAARAPRGPAPTRVADRLPASSPGVRSTTTRVPAAHRSAALVVHVAGAVRTPGVLELPAGARVVDAVEGAGGALSDADLDRLNLAAKLLDGQRVLVPKVGAASADAPPGSGADPGTSLIDLNNATAAQLEQLPGIGPALAAAIIAERDRRGGFRSVNELREVRGIGERRFADIRDLVMV
jgi:competence protein ComEA